MVVHACLQVALSRVFLPPNFDVWNWKTNIWRGKRCKIHLSQKLDFSWFLNTFFIIWVAPGHFMTLVALETGLKFDAL